MTQLTTGYTTDEITQAVTNLVQASISRPNDTLGPARSDITFGDIQNAAAGVFLLYPKAPFYCLYLGTQRILQAVAAESAVIEQLVAAVQVVGRSVLPISDLTPLFNATAALQALGTAASSRTTGFTDITKVPQFQQFTKNVSSFLGGAAGKAVKSGGQVVMTPQEARAAIPGLVTQFQQAHQTLIQSVSSLAGGEDDYNKVNLAATVAQSVIANATVVLQQHATTLNGLQPQQRLASIRQTVLDMIAAQAVVTQYGSNQGTVDIYDMLGTGIPYSDSNDLANPASAVASVVGAYNIQSPNQYLDLYVDGTGATHRTMMGITSVVPVGFGFVANLVGTVPVDVLVGDYVFINGGSNNNTRWIIQSIGAGFMTATGVVAPIADSGAIPVEVLPPPSIEVVLPFSQSATILGVVLEGVHSAGNGYIISNGTHPTRFPSSVNIPAANNLIILKVGATTYNCPLTLSADAVGSTDAIPRTAQQVCNDITTGLVGSNFQAVPYYPVVKFQGSVIQTAAGGSSATFALVGGFSNFLNLGISIGDSFEVLNGDPTQLGLWSITNVTSTVLTATMVSLGTADTQLDAVQIQVGSPLRGIKLTAINPTTAVNALTSLSVVNDGGVGSSGAGTLGLSPGGTARSAPSTSKVIASFILANTQVCSASTLFTPLASVNGRTNPTSALLLTLTKLQETVSTSVVGTMLSAPMAGAFSAGALVGDYLVERSGQFPGTVWELTTVTDFSITANLVSGSSVGQASVQLEIGPNVSLPPYSMIRIPSGPNDGDYYVSSQSFIDITLVNSMPQPSDPTTLQALTFPVMAGTETLVISSTNETTSSLVKVRGPAASAFYTSGDLARSTGVAGTTVYFQIPNTPQGLDVGDLLQFYTTNYATPSQVQTITDVNGLVLTLDGPIPSNASYPFGPTAPLPYARIHTGHVASFSDFQAAILAWASLPEQQALYFTNLNALINPLIANSSPTAVQVNTAVQVIAQLFGELTIAAATTYGQPTISTIEAILDSYVVLQQPPVDALVRSYLEKGADRAVDLLLGGSFQEFFGLDPSSTSYAGAMQSAARAVAMNDLPVKKTNRTNTQTSRLTASTTDPDPEYNFDDSASATPDPLSPDERADGS